uniref:Uncharacterized protein n=1 Tax=Arundo donax TaxID=35708 RepID=A0A0A9GDP2_ARUDO
MLSCLNWLRNFISCSNCFKDSADLASSGIILTSFIAQRAPVCLLVASYTQPNVPLPRSRPFCH